MRSGGETGRVEVGEMGEIVWGNVEVTGRWRFQVVIIVRYRVCDPWLAVGDRLSGLWTL
jgi:hypothetical protein